VNFRQPIYADKLFFYLELTPYRRAITITPARWPDCFWCTALLVESLMNVHVFRPHNSHSWRCYGRTKRRLWYAFQHAFFAHAVQSMAREATRICNPHWGVHAGLASHIERRRRETRRKQGQPWVCVPLFGCGSPATEAQRPVLSSSWRL
jgi:hypothetical protein